jgi:hypothetical protein
MYIQKRNGENFVAYFVDEDRDDYHFRKELYSPAEFKVPRRELLFMSEGNPSALKGDAGTDRVTLSWLPPYGQVKHYKIYMKMKKKSEYKVAGVTGGKEFRLSGLAPVTTYFFVVRAVDDTGYETSPSNEIQVKTKSRLPDAPEVKAVRGNNESWNLSWEEPDDEDGKIEKYRVYIEKGGKYSQLKETKELKTVITREIDYDTIHVRAVDNNGDESEALEYRNRWRLQLTPRYWVPVMKMSDFSGSGLGATLDISRRDIFFDDFELGFTGGGISLEGKKKIGSGSSNVTLLRMYPAAVFCGYRVPIWFDRFQHYDVFSVFPRFSAGIMSAHSDFEILNNAGDVDELKTSFMVSPFVSAGMAVEAGFSRNFFVTLGGDFLYIIDYVQGLGMINIAASAGYRF